MADIEIRPLEDSPAVRRALAEMLVEVVANGGSVNFMHPLPLETAEVAWADWLAAAARGERIVLGAFDGETLAATVSLLPAPQPNQPHRAEIGKMMTRVSHRGRGLARALLQAAEVLARGQGRSLLVLDTAVEDGAAGLYEKQGYSLAGIIPDYAYKPHGGLTGSAFYYKRI
ncbi:ribosomal protein S18 acetylase RimI-like enzyme [Caulobacter ginsengisoli]|uniref:Ribosomal protein S18 acetylase RimI-like enzyme n=1 Tax=Caulobacter ginsengisoli TaxID=400775 RepID=A0ABU0ISK4_9CAUL|nr:GNAT family N-acetyltransferase [Caulobacter ginsengisoli]MDQ0464009.1 ribosomal protein S18 acetylase RimI-like enzyme [Caulobacter ginsengisoli]